MNISIVKDCYGCGVCAIICPKKIIKISLNSSGFYEPHIVQKDKCIDCSLCANVCSYVSDKIISNNEHIESYAAWSNDENIRHECSSGGISFEIGKFLINKGYKVCAVKYNNEKHIAEHYIATNIEELKLSIGSKYIQSYTVDAFNQINKKEKYLITGTPCQIDSFRRYIKQKHIENNFILMDFFCHGVPSMLIWEKYIRYIEEKYGKISSISWRNKLPDWHKSYNIVIKSETNEKIISRLSDGDYFYQLFFSDLCLGKACYDKCKFKYNNSSADIRIGDLWGNAYKNNTKGVNAVITFTEIGRNVIKELNCNIVEHHISLVTEGQMKNAPSKDPYYNKFISLIQKGYNIQDICSKLKQHKKKVRFMHILKHPLKSAIRYIRNKNKLSSINNH